jgi:hypothetical protein
MAEQEKQSEDEAAAIHARVDADGFTAAMRDAMPDDEEW